LDNLKIDDIPVSMDGKSTIAMRVAFEKIEFKCQARLDDAGVCSSQPCLNGGTCLEHPGSGSYQCTCSQPRYQGSQCELDRFVHTAKRIPDRSQKLQLFQNLTTDSLLMYNVFFVDIAMGKFYFDLICRTGRTILCLQPCTEHVYLQRMCCQMFA
jgi:hypothetical protein